MEKSAVWGEELWCATLDVEKAFDEVFHHELFKVLVDCDINMSAVGALRRLYRGMQAYVQISPGAESRRFEIRRGVRQGDPLSPVLFNLVMTKILQEVEEVWQRRGYGTNVGQDLTGKRLTHVAFAYDTTLVSRSWISLKRMVLSLRDALRKRGLELHPTKCKAQTNRPGAFRGKVRIAEDMHLHVLEEHECLEVLGTHLALQNATQFEIDHRIALAWRKFRALKSLILNRNVSRRRRLHIFDASVGSSFLFGAHTWTPRVEELRKMQTVQNRMLRKICGFPRRLEEEWLPWMRRVTHASNDCAVQAGVRNWVKTHASRKWAWAGHVSRRPASTWLWRVTFWRDSVWNQDALEMREQKLLRPSRGAG